MLSEMVQRTLKGSNAPQEPFMQKKYTNLAVWSEDIHPFSPFTAEMVDIKRLNDPINK